MLWNTVTLEGGARTYKAAGWEGNKRNGKTWGKKKDLMTTFCKLGASTGSDRGLKNFVWYRPRQDLPATSFLQLSLTAAPCIKAVLRINLTHQMQFQSYKPSTNDFENRVDVKTLPFWAQGIYVYLHKKKIEQITDAKYIRFANTMERKKLFKVEGQKLTIKNNWIKLRDNYKRITSKQQLSSRNYRTPDS